MKFRSPSPLPCLAVPILALGASAQSGGFSAQKLISTDADRAQDVYAADLDGDGDIDVLSASRDDDTVAWYENLGGGVLAAGQVITAGADGASSVFAIDLDGDGDVDVLSTSQNDDTIAWYENLGGGAFGAASVISTAADYPKDVFAIDLDGDGDADVLSASLLDNRVAWYENLGGGAFGPQLTITTAAEATTSVHATDLDGDGDADVLSVSFADDKLAWYENLGGGAFGPQQVITTDNAFPVSVHAADLDGDGDADPVTASRDDSKVAWHENLGAGSFGPQQVLSIGVAGVTSVHAADFDLDGDADVLAGGSGAFDRLAWFENLGGGAFEPLQAIIPENDQDAIFIEAVFAADLDGDGDPDALSASAGDDKVAWYANQLPTATTFGAGCGSPPLGFEPTSTATLGGAVSGRITNALSVTWVALGVSDTASPFGPLPFDLGALGFAGCSLYQSLDLDGLPTQATGVPGVEDWALAVPADPTLAGVHVFAQAFSVAADLGSFQLATSDGVDWQLGL